MFSHDKKIKNQKMRIVGLEPMISCVRDRDDTTVPHTLYQTQLTEQILVLNPIHASVIPQIL